MPDFTVTPLPTLNLLSVTPVDTLQSNSSELVEMARAIESCLALYNVAVEVVDILSGPIFTLFELQLAPGVMVNRIVALEHDLARTLSAERLRVMRTIPGKPHVGIELLNKYRQAVYLRDVLDSAEFRENSSPLAVALGKDITGKPVVADLGKMPHLMVGGMTGSGKSVLLDVMIISMLYKATPQQVRFIMIDPKMLDLSLYEGIPHLLTNVITDMQEATNALRWCVVEVERRYRLMSALGVRNLDSYNERIDQADTMQRAIPDPFWKPSDSRNDTPPLLEREPYIVVIADNFSELMMAAGEQVKEAVTSLAQKGHVVGIHLILSTSLPSVAAMASSIKASVPARVALTVRSKGDSNVILEQGGAELLFGAGDMLYMSLDSNEVQRVHGAFANEHDIYAVVRDWQVRVKPQYQRGVFNPNVISVGLDAEEELDPLFDQAVEFVVDKRRASISGVQRQFRIGYNRAVRLVEQMEARGIVSECDHNGYREVLVLGR